MSRRTRESEDAEDYDERSRKWREENEIEAYALEYEDEVVDLDEPDNE